MTAHKVGPTDAHPTSTNRDYDGHPYSATQALAVSMISTGLRPDAAMHRAEAMQIELLAMGYELTPVELIK